jgi:hypothetical protein
MARTPKAKGDVALLGADEKPEAEREAVMPQRIRLITPFGFYDADDHLRMWQAGFETADADEIASLLARGAECEALE